MYIYKLHVCVCLCIHGCVYLCMPLSNIPFGKNQCQYVDFPCLFLCFWLGCFLFAVHSTMNKFRLLVLMVFCSGLFINTSTSVSTRPDVVNIGAIFSFNSSIGKVSKVTIEAAIKDVNSNPAVLVGTKLKLSMQDTKLSSGFLGIVEGMFFVTSLVCSFSPFHFLHNASWEFYTGYVIHVLLQLYSWWRIIQWPYLVPSTQLWLM